MAGKVRITQRHIRERGVGAILAMMFLVIFSSLAAAMVAIAEYHSESAG